MMGWRLKNWLSSDLIPQWSECWQCEPTSYGLNGLLTQSESLKHPSKHSVASREYFNDLG